MKVVLATHESTKPKYESVPFQNSFKIGWDIISVSELGDIQEPEETGRTLKKMHYKSSLLCKYHTVPY